MTPEFLDVEDVLVLHAQQIEERGGSDGIRDIGLLDSAVAQPQMMFGGEFFHPTIFLMAAAYLYHIVRNHPFVDANKRTGLMAALVFLDLHGHPIDREIPELETLTLAVAAGTIEKEGLAAKLESLTASDPI